MSDVNPIRFPIRDNLDIRKDAHVKNHEKEADAKNSLTIANALADGKVDPLEFSTLRETYDNTTLNALASGEFTVNIIEELENAGYAKDAITQIQERLQAQKNNLLLQEKDVSKPKEDADNELKEPVDSPNNKSFGI